MSHRKGARQHNWHSRARNRERNTDGGTSDPPPSEGWSVQHHQRPRVNTRNKMDESPMLSDVHSLVHASKFYLEALLPPRPVRVINQPVTTPNWERTSVSTVAIALLQKKRYRSWERRRPGVRPAAMQGGLRRSIALRNL